MNIKKVERKRLDMPINVLLNIVDYHNFNISEMIKIPGKLKTLLGKPSYTSINYEDWFGYYIEYNGVYFEIYGNALETHISGEVENRELAIQLAKKILEQTTADYEWTCYCMDYATKITLGFKNNTAYQENKQIKLNDEEWQQLYCEVYQISKEG